MAKNRGDDDKDKPDLAQQDFEKRLWGDTEIGGQVGDDEIDPAAVLSDEEIKRLLSNNEE